MRSRALRAAQSGLRGASRTALQQLSAQRPSLVSSVATRANARASSWPNYASVGCRSLSSTAPVRADERQFSTPLAKQLTDAINTTGPVPLSSFMRMCLTADVGGYYTGALEKSRDQFGRRGDFITSPEISQVFGELIGIWFVAEWMSQGRPSKGVELIEVGPGRGTLMDDILRTIRNFKPMADAIDAVYMVEASGELREAQKKLLCGEDATLAETGSGWQSRSKYSDLPVIWAESIRGVPKSPGKMPLIIAHEFFDALPIHAFQVVEVAAAPKPQQQPASAGGAESAASSSSSSNASAKPSLQWREMVVSPVPEGTSHADLRTPAAEVHDGEPVPEFQLGLSNAATRHSKYLPESSARYKALRSTPGALIEVCPDATLYAADMAERIGGGSAASRAAGRPPSGAALILDYGPADSIPTGSLRGIRAHRRVSPFSAPGQVDLSADVDFLGIVEAANAASPGVECHGPVEQASFLEAMGIKERADMLVKKVLKDGAAGTPGAQGGEEAARLRDRAAEIDRAWRRLVDRSPAGMGKVYKALAILPENGGRRRPVGFGGDI